MRKHTTLIITLLLSIVQAWAVPAKRGPRTMSQPDGTHITVYLHGDETYNYYTDAEGYIMQRDSQGVFVRGEKQTEENIRSRRAASPIRHNSTKPNRIGTPNTNAARGLFILVNFTDSTFKQENSLAEMNKMLNEEGYNYGGSPGSVRDYFITQSDGRYTPYFDVFGPVTLNHPESYYGKNNAKGNDALGYQMIIDACTALDSQIDFTRYDSNNDGKIDFVYVIFAGKGANDGGQDDDIWAHQHYVSFYVRVGFDGKQLDSYACGPELNGSGQRSGIGVLCHEFGHVLGLPDYYDINYSDNYNNAITPNEWSLMDYGAYNNNGYCPPNYSAHDKYFLGWATPTLLNSPENVVLPADNKTSRYITSDGTSATATTQRVVYYLENRQQTGWDEYLPGHGLVVWRVDYRQSIWNLNTPNSTKDVVRYAVVSSSGETTNIGMCGTWGDEFCNRDPFPGKGGVTVFYPFLASGQDAGSCTYPLTDISEQAGIIRFKMQGGIEEHYDTCAAYSWTATEALTEETMLLGDYEWTILTEDNTTLSYDEIYGAQFGSESAPVGLIMLGTEATDSCIIEKLTITASTDETGDATMKVLIGGHPIGEVVSLTNETNGYSFYNTEGYIGGITIEIENTSGIVYLKSIQTNSSNVETNVEQTGAQSPAAYIRKIVQNGKVIILRNGEQYDVLGRRM